jgi:hypothetical protein
MVTPNSGCDLARSFFILIMRRCFRKGIWSVRPRMPPSLRPPHSCHKNPLHLLGQFERTPPFAEQLSSLETASLCGSIQSLTLHIVILQTLAVLCAQAHSLCLKGELSNVFLFLLCRFDFCLLFFHSIAHLHALQRREFETRACGSTAG